MSRETTLRDLLRAIERQRELGFSEFGDPLNLEAIETIERETRIRLAAEELADGDYLT